MLNQALARAGLNTMVGVKILRRGYLYELWRERRLIGCFSEAAIERRAEQLARERPN